jgi:hypothetical protein
MVNPAIFISSECSCVGTQDISHVPGPGSGLLCLPPMTKIEMVSYYLTVSFEIIEKQTKRFWKRYNVLIQSFFHSTGRGEVLGQESVESQAHIHFGTEPAAVLDQDGTLVKVMPGSSVEIVSLC